jgi:hypothetical protein
MTPRVISLTDLYQAHLLVTMALVSKVVTMLWHWPLYLQYWVYKHRCKHHLMSSYLQDTWESGLGMYQPHQVLAL